MSGMNQPSPLLLQPPPTPRSPTRFAARVGEYVKAGFAMVIWMLVAAASLGALYIGLWATYWAINRLSEALGV